MKPSSVWAVDHLGAGHGLTLVIDHLPGEDD